MVFLRIFLFSVAKFTLSAHYYKNILEIIQHVLGLVAMLLKFGGHGIFFLRIFLSAPPISCKQRPPKHVITFQQRGFEHV